MTTQPSQPMSAHTPLPWKFVPWHIEEGPPAVRAPAGHIVCTTASDEDAKFIELACNSHASLKARIEELEGALRGLLQFVPLARIKSNPFTNVPEITKHNQVLDAAINTANAALQSKGAA